MFFCVGYFVFTVFRVSACVHVPVWQYSSVRATRGGAMTWYERGAAYHSGRVHAMEQRVGALIDTVGNGGQLPRSARVQFFTLARQVGDAVD